MARIANDATAIAASCGHMQTTANLQVLQMKHAMTNKQKLHLLTMLVLPIVYLPAFSGCSSIEGTDENQGW